MADKFVVVAGKFEHNGNGQVEKNFKFIGEEHSSLEVAMAELKLHASMPFAYIEYANEHGRWELSLNPISE